jgi:hypothetical protein
MKKCLFLLALILIRMNNASAQGFVNLDFESANLSGYSAGSVPAADAIPGWTAYLGGTVLTSINYDVNDAFGPPGAYIYNSANLQGNYYAYVQGTPSEPASIGQTGTIPATAQSLIWWGDGPEVSFNDQPLSVTFVGATDYYTIFSADISAFAGQTGQLLFTSSHYPNAPGDQIDNIQFSSSGVPEPSTFGLLTLVGSLFSLHRRAIIYKRTSSLLFSMAILIETLRKPF